MATSESAHDVVIVGAGPAGTMLAIELGRRGVDVHLVERREGRLRHPRASGIHARTMEYFRQLGLADEVRRAGGLPVEDWSSFGYLTRLKDPDIGAIDMMAAKERIAGLDALSPEFLAWCAQDTLEGVLRKHALTFPSISVTYGLRAVGVDQDDAGATVTLADDENGTEHLARARYVVGADGGRSTVRAAAGISSPESPTMSHQVNVCFEADLRPFLKGRNYILYFIINPDTQGAFVTYDGDRRWVYSWDYDPERQSPDDFTPEYCAAVIRTAIGSSDVDIRVESTFFWKVQSALADSFHEGRVFLVGDAAHRFPPTGGFGMNSSLQDAQNLGWKLHEVLRGGAGPELLDTYDAERRTTARRNIATTLATATKSAEVGWFANDPTLLAEIEGPRGESVRQRIAEGIPAQEPQFWSYGQQFGVTYDSTAVIPDGSSPVESTVVDYWPTARPGAHAPHVWLESLAGERLSTIDLLHSLFVVLAPPAGQAWVDAAKGLTEARGTEIDAFTIGAGGDYRDPEGNWAECYGLDPTGVVVVRPDGYVAFRAAKLSAGQSPAEVLDDAFDRLLSTTTSRTSGR
ncbi:MAG: tfdB 2 [Amycolatopsis sp.]|uniref:FAD-dependent monooxygenase n=1 Tax=Amycolatopsis sp. TaxID=37632 RepID=UPI002610AA19|nr:FAD-dependent monooxygenase [Amycolatopsis sp.]MCU1682023.1 tfdB 2 [Amycolatopsis sp.]